MAAKRKTSARARTEPTKPRFGVDDVLRVIAGALFIVLPFVVSFSGEDKFRLPKLLFATISIIILCAIYLGSRRPRIVPRWKSWEALVVAGIAFVGIRSLLAPDPWQSLGGFFNLSLFAALAFVLKEVATARFQRILWFCIGAAGAVSAVMTVLQYFGKFSLLVTARGETLQGRLNAAGLLGDVQSGALLFALSSLMLLHWVFASCHPAIRALAALLVVLNLAGLAFTRTLTALVAYFIVAVVWLGYQHWWQLRRRKTGRLALALVWVVLLGAGAVAWYSAERSGLADRVSRVIRLVKRGDWSVATAGRQPVYAMTWEMISRAPLRGIGPERFGSAFFDYRSDTPQGQARNLIEQPGAFQQVHNDYLEFWLELGIPGLILFLAALTVPLWGGLRRLWGQAAEESHWTALNILGVALIMVDALGFFPFQITLGAALTALLLASLRHGESPPALPPDPGLRRWDQKIRWVLVIVIAVVLIRPHWRVWSANLEIARATAILQRVYQPGLPLRLVRASAQSTLESLERAQEKCRRCYRLYDLKGSALLLLGRYDDAIESYGVAAYYLPTSEVFTNLGQAYLQAHKPAEARESFEKALRYRPDYIKARQALDRLHPR